MPKTARLSIPVAANDNSPRLDHPDLYDVEFRPDPPLPPGAANWHGGPTVPYLITQAAALNAANDNIPLVPDAVVSRARKRSVAAEYALGWLADVLETARHAPKHPIAVAAMIDAQKRLAAIADGIGSEAFYTLVAGLDGATAEDVGRCYGKTYKRASALGSNMTDLAIDALVSYFWDRVPRAA